MSSRNLRIRTAIVFFFCIGCYTVLLCNLFVIQIMNQSFFANLGMHQYTLMLCQLPSRAPILDRHGTVLATNTSSLSAFLIPKEITDYETIQQFLTTHFPQAAQRLPHRLDSSFFYIKRRLTEPEKELIAACTAPDIHLLEESSRFYRLISAAPVIGFTDIDNVGRAGIELSHNSQLTGTPTKMRLEKDARSGYFYFSKEIQQEGQESVPVQLTLDTDLQFLVDDEIKRACEQCHATETNAVILNPLNGDLLALSSYPSALPNDPYFDFHYTKPRAVTEQYELGSVLKVCAALAALEEGVVTPDELIDCKQSSSCIIDGRPITTCTPHGLLPFCDVIAFSNNIGIAQLAKRLGPRIYDHYQRLGFGKKTGIPLAAEAAGFVNPPSKWSRQSIISLSYGYEISASLLQLAQAFALIAHEGKKVTPRLLLSDPITISEEALYSSKSIAAIRDILRKTTTHGTGKRAQLAGFDVMSKTGSANTLVNGRYDHDKNMYTAAAIIEKGNYKRVVVVSVKEADTPHAFASTIAMPLLRRIAEKMVIHERVV